MPRPLGHSDLPVITWSKENTQYLLTMKYGTNARDKERWSKRKKNKIEKRLRKRNNGK
jgi:hypothetical protein